jgi:hypothetical protein
MMAITTSSSISVKPRSVLALIRRFLPQVDPQERVAVLGRARSTGDSQEVTTGIPNGKSWIVRRRRI